MSFNRVHQKIGHFKRSNLSLLLRMVKCGSLAYSSRAAVFHSTMYFLWDVHPSSLPMLSYEVVNAHLLWAHHLSWFSTLKQNFTKFEELHHCSKRAYDIFPKFVGLFMEVRDFYGVSCPICSINFICSLFQKFLKCCVVVSC